MSSYILRRLLLMIPTLFGIILINFLIVQAAPGGPVEQMIARVQGIGGDATARFGGGGGETSANMNAALSESQGGGSSGKYRGAQGLPPEFIEELEKQRNLRLGSRIPFSSTSSKHPLIPLPHTPPHPQPHKHQ